MRKYIFIFLLAFPVLSWGQQDPISLESIMLDIETNYPELQRYQSLIDAADERVAAARAWMPPTVSVGLDRMPYNPEMLSEEAPMNQSGLMIGVEQMFPNRERNRLRAELAANTGTEQEALRELSIRRFKRQASNAFLGVLYAEKKKQKIEDNLRVLRILYETSTQKIPFGTSKTADIYKIEARMGEAENMIIMANTEERANKALLNALLRRKPDSEIILDTASYKDPGIVINDPGNLAERPDIRAMQDRINRMAIERNLMNVQRRPEFGVQFTHMQMFAMSPMYAVMGMMTIPFAPWSSSMYKSGTKAMEFEIEAMEKEKESMVLMAGGMVAEITAMATGINEQLENLRAKIIPALNKALQAEINEYGQNTGNLYVLLDTWEMLLMKELEAINLENQYRERLIELEFETYAP